MESLSSHFIHTYQLIESRFALCVLMIDAKTHFLSYISGEWFIFVVYDPFFESSHFIYVSLVSVTEIYFQIHARSRTLKFCNFFL